MSDGHPDLFMSLISPNGTVKCFSKRDHNIEHFVHFVFFITFLINIEQNFDFCGRSSSGLGSKSPLIIGQKVEKCSIVYALLMKKKNFQGTFSG